MTNTCNPYYDAYGRKTNLMHVAEGATYPINITGNAATADSANLTVTSLSEESDVIAFRAGDELDDKRNEYNKTINNVKNAIQAEQDSDGNKITETYAKKDEVVVLDESGKIPTDILPDTANNVNFVNGKTGDVNLTANDIPYSELLTTAEKIDAVVEDTNTALSNLDTNKADKSEVPSAGFALSQEDGRINSVDYSIHQVGGNLQLRTTDKDGNEEIKSDVVLQAAAVFQIAPQTVFKVPSTRVLEVNMDSAEGYNIGYYYGQDQTTGTWTIRNTGTARIWFLLFGGRSVASGSRESIAPRPFYLDVNATTTFVLDSDDPYMDKNTFSIQVFKLGAEA